MSIPLGAVDYGLVTSFALGIAGYLLGVRIVHTASRIILGFLLLLVLVALEYDNISWQLSDIRSNLPESYQYTAFIYWSNLICILLGLFVAFGIDRERDRIGFIRLTLAAIVGAASLLAFVYLLFRYKPDLYASMFTLSFLTWPFYQRAITIIGAPLTVVAIAIAVVTRSFVGTAVGLCGALVLTTILSAGGEWLVPVFWPSIPFIIIGSWLGAKIVQK